MKTFDNEGLRLAEYQGKLFEYSLKVCKCSTKIFIRRFYYSSLLITLDKNDISTLSLNPIEGLNEIEQEFGVSKYGQKKINKDVLFWIGYLYRYISYTRNVRTQFIMQTFNFDLLCKLYKSYHTQNMEWVVRSLLELKKLNENYFDPNWRIKTIKRNNLYNFEYDNNLLIKLIKDYVKDLINLKEASVALGCSKSEFKRMIKLNKNKI